VLTASRSLSGRLAQEQRSLARGVDEERAHARYGPVADGEDIDAAGNWCVNRAECPRERSDVCADVSLAIFDKYDVPGDTSEESCCFVVDGSVNTTSSEYTSWMALRLATASRLPNTSCRLAESSSETLGIRHPIDVRVQLESPTFRRRRDIPPRPQAGRSPAYAPEPRPNERLLGIESADTLAGSVRL